LFDCLPSVHWHWRMETVLIHIFGKWHFQVQWLRILRELNTCGTPQVIGCIQHQDHSVRVVRFERG
jgi:hypothetical protein